MCRIAGIISPEKSIEELYRQVKAMCDIMKHGGPDDEGIYLNPEKGLCFGHRRLSLLDLSEAGHQPMSALDEKIWISYNGEVYNFREIRSELERLGHVFSSGTDTEVILKSYIQWGTEAFSRFNGMFAFALADLSKEKVYLVRDAAGIKPLYYTLSSGKLIFASEVKAFKQVDKEWYENPDWQLLLLAFGHIPEPYTTLKAVYSLPKGNFLEYDILTGAGELKTFRKTGFDKTNITSKEEAKAVIRQKLQAAVKRHLISDAPVGLFLSGGIDSSLLTILAAEEIKEQLHTLSVTFAEEKFSEQQYQQAVIDQVKCKHQFYRIGEKDLEENLENLLGAYDQPSNDAINSWFISKCAKENGLKAVLSGLGSDEIFGGYPSFNRMPDFLRLQHLPAFMLNIARFIPKNQLQRLQWLRIKNSSGLYLAIRGFFTPEEIAKITGLSVNEVIERIASLTFQPEPDQIKADEYACWLEFNRYMQNQLLRDSDYMSMQHGLELRVPFLDQEFLDAVFSIDTDLLYNHKGLPKQLLIDSFKDRLPETVWNRKKMGFTFPFQNWLGKTDQIRSGLSGDPFGKALLKNFDSDNLHWSKLWTYYLSQYFAAAV